MKPKNCSLLRKKQCRTETSFWHFVPFFVVIKCDTYNTIEQFDMDSKAEYSAFAHVARIKETKTNASAPLIQYRLRSVKAVRKE